MKNGGKLYVVASSITSFPTVFPLCLGQHITGEKTTTKPPFPPKENTQIELIKPIELGRKYYQYKKKTIQFPEVFTYCYSFKKKL